MYELTVERGFAAAHCLRGYDGPCSRLHGHNYRVEVTVAGRELDAHGMLMDFGILKAVCDAVIEPLDHQHLNEVEPFVETNPTSENLARFVFASVAASLRDPAQGIANPVRVTRVRIWESATSVATYSGDE
jgi:6-pyruvoyltetrahydropterin/6-carboxytetrahydropterin synthase